MKNIQKLKQYQGAATRIAQQGLILIKNLGWIPDERPGILMVYDHSTKEFQTLTIGDVREDKLQILIDRGLEIAEQNLSYEKILYKTSVRTRDYVFVFVGEKHEQKDVLDAMQLIAAAEAVGWAFAENEKRTLALIRQEVSDGGTARVWNYILDICTNAQVVNIDKLSRKPPLLGFKKREQAA